MSAADKQGTDRSSRDTLAEYRERLDRDVHAGECAQRVLDRLATLRNQMTGLAEDLHEHAEKAFELASSDLTEFDRQSQGALDESSRKVREASRRLFSHVSDPALEKHEQRIVVRSLEAEHRFANAADARIMTELLERRTPLNRKRDDAARDLLLSGLAQIVALESSRAKLTAAVEAGHRSMHEREDLLRLERLKRLSVNGADIHLGTPGARY